MTARLFQTLGKGLPLAIAVPDEASPVWISLFGWWHSFSLLPRFIFLILVLWSLPLIYLGVGFFSIIAFVQFLEFESLYLLWTLGKIVIIFWIFYLRWPSFSCFWTYCHKAESLVTVSEAPKDIFIDFFPAYFLLAFRNGHFTLLFCLLIFVSSPFCFEPGSVKHVWMQVCACV